jgi:uncharacterized protein YfaP (DUF2135 family)
MEAAREVFWELQIQITVMNLRNTLHIIIAAWCCFFALIALPEGRAQIVNTSVRVQVGTGANILITGFVIGSTPKTLLFRAVGPGLAAFGVPGTLVDPTMTVYSGQTAIGSNNDWGSTNGTAIAQASASSGAFALPVGSKDAALIATLQPGAYTVQISGADGGSGVAIFEAYEIVAPAVPSTPPSSTTATGTLRGIIRDGVTNNGVSGVALAFTDSTGAAVGSATTGSTGEYSATLPATTVRVAVSASGYVSTLLLATVVANTTTQADNVLFAQNIAGTGTISGRITNAFTGVGLPGATVQLRAGANITSGTVVATGTTNSSGDFTINANSGTYTAEVSLTGFVTTDFVVVAVGGRTISNQNYTVTPVLSGSELRVVLTWGASPRDLDSHLTGPVSGGSSRFHVYYSSKSTTGVKLDVDDTESYGPETVTISEFAPGIYRYSVHDYTNRGSSSSTGLSSSGAQVKVFQGSSLVTTFNVPTGQTGSLWTVFEMDGATKTITPKNTFSNQSTPSAVPFLQPGVVQVLSEDDGGLLRRLPPKD